MLTTNDPDQDSSNSQPHARDRNSLSRMRNPPSISAKPGKIGSKNNLRFLLKLGTVVPINKSERNEFMRIARNQIKSVPDPFQIEALAETPDVRADKVARGKALIADPNYPSKDQMKRIAGLLAEKMAGRDLSSNPAPSPRRAFSPLQDNVVNESVHH
jgi:hypothetical protein